ncbi:MAG: hypothetical protein NTU76_01055 [Candidatus Taylorbacteria bacterium]|nr:hypothetical protein [Candidatus Taylorbacteria bacterium]
MPQLKKAIVLVGIIFLFLLITVLRRPDAITYPQFHAEDGVFWYTEAYNATNPITPFLIPKQKYFQTISRVGASASMFFDISHAPLIFNSLAIIIQILPAVFFLSKRFERIVPKTWQRFLIGTLYLVLPATHETHVNLTNAMWRLALLMFLIIVATPPKKTWQKFSDGFLLSIAGLSGPFVFFAFPVALVHAYLKSFRERISNLIIICVAFLIQAYSFLFIISDSMRLKVSLGAGLLNFFKILGLSVFINGLIGLDNKKYILDLTLWKNGKLPVIVSLIGIGLLMYVFWKAKNELRLFIIFAFLIFGASLITPQVSSTKPQWEAMASGGGVNRYYFFPVVAWVFSLTWLFFKGESKIMKSIAGLLLICLLLIGIPADFIWKPYKDYKFQEQVTKFKQLNPGESLTFKIYPNWEMPLVRK